MIHRDVISFQQAAGDAPNDTYITIGVRAVFGAPANGVVRMAFREGLGKHGHPCQPPAGFALAVLRLRQQLPVQQIFDIESGTLCYDLYSQQSYSISQYDEALYYILPQTQTQSYLQPLTAGLRARADIFAVLASNADADADDVAAEASAAGAHVVAAAAAARAASAHFDAADDAVSVVVFMARK